MSSRSTVGSSASMTAELVGDLRAAEHDDVRAVGRLAPAAAAPRPRAAPASRRSAAAARATSYTLACLRCTAPNASSTYASPNAASARANAPRSASSLLVSPALKRRFSSSTHPAVGQPGDGRGGRLADGVRGEGDRRAEQLGHPGRRPGRASTSGPARPWAGPGATSRRGGRRRRAARSASAVPPGSGRHR